jgi:hypothetical protein
MQKRRGGGVTLINKETLKIIHQFENNKKQSMQNENLPAIQEYDRRGKSLFWKKWLELQPKKVEKLKRLEVNFIAFDECAEVTPKAWEALKIWKPTNTAESVANKISQQKINHLIQAQLENAKTYKCEETGLEEWSDEEIQRAKQRLKEAVASDYESYFDDLAEDDFKSDVDYQNERNLRIKEVINLINNC